jgi:hypothetical protein
MYKTALLKYLNINAKIKNILTTLECANISVTKKINCQKQHKI